MEVSFSVLVFILLYFALASVFFMLLSAFFTKLPTYLLVSNMLILFGAVIGGGMIPIRYLPKGMADVAKATVNFWFLGTSTTLYFGGETMSIAFIAMILLGIVLGVILSSLLIKRKEGMNREDV
jgi:ABC-2 type transport system permease protein